MEGEVEDWTMSTSLGEPGTGCGPWQGGRPTAALRIPGGTCIWGPLICPGDLCMRWCVGHRQEWPGSGKGLGLILQRLGLTNAAGLGDLVEGLEQIATQLLDIPEVVEHGVGEVHQVVQVDGVALGPPEGHGELCCLACRSGQNTVSHTSRLTQGVWGRAAPSGLCTGPLFSSP